MQDRLDLAEVDEHIARVVLLLDHAADNVALAPGILTESELVLGVAQALKNDLLRRGGRDSVEVAGRVVEFADRVTVVVHLGGKNRHLAGGPVDQGPRVSVRALGPLIRNQQRGFDRLDKQFERDVLLAFEAAQGSHVDVHPATSP